MGFNPLKPLDAPQGVKSAQSNSAAVGEILAREELSVLLRSGRRRGGNRAYRHPFSQYSRKGGTGGDSPLIKIIEEPTSL